MFKIYDYGVGGKHRDNRDARNWRNETSRIAKYISARYPNMPMHVARDHAQVELTHAYSLANHYLIQRTQGVAK